jgi:hypothetical protein
VLDIYFPGTRGDRRVNYCFVTFDNWKAAQRAADQSERRISGKVRWRSVGLGLLGFIESF